MEGARKRDKKAVDKGIKDEKDVKKHHKAHDEESKRPSHKPNQGSSKK